MTVIDLNKIIAKADLAIEMREKASPMVAGMGYLGDIPPEVVKMLCNELLELRGPIPEPRTEAVKEDE